MSSSGMVRYIMYYWSVSGYGSAEKQVVNYPKTGKEADIWNIGDTKEYCVNVDHVLRKTAEIRQFCVKDVLTSEIWTADEFKALPIVQKVIDTAKHETYVFPKLSVSPICTKKPVTINGRVFQYHIYYGEPDCINYPKTVEEITKDNRGQSVVSVKEFDDVIMFTHSLEHKNFLVFDSFANKWFTATTLTTSQLFKTYVDSARSMYNDRA